MMKNELLFLTDLVKEVKTNAALNTREIISRLQTRIEDLKLGYSKEDVKEMEDAERFTAKPFHEKNFSQFSVDIMEGMK